MVDNKHMGNLLESTRFVVNENDIIRIKFLEQEKWILYPEAKRILDSMDNLRNYPKKSRMPCMLLVGESNNGKTSILQQFRKMNEPDEIFVAENLPLKIRIKVIYILAPASPNIGELYHNILNRFAGAYKRSDTNSAKFEMVKNSLARCSVQVLIIDEIHNILSGPISKQKEFMNTLKNLTNELQMPIILAGTKDALHATNTDTQISSRFKPIFLPKWKLDRDYLSLLASLEKTLPLRKTSNLGTTKEVALKILDLSEGYIGEITDLVEMASIYAIKTKSEKIGVKELKECGYVRPSDRKNFSKIVSL